MAELRGISNFKSTLTGGGARPNLFEVNISTLPQAVSKDPQGLQDSIFNERDFSFLCKAAALPASNIAPIDVPFRGRILKVAGDRTFDTWTVTVINDENFTVRKSFEAWMQNINQYADHSGLTNPSDYMHNAIVYQLGRSAVKRQGPEPSAGKAKVLAQYKFVDIFPTNISQIDLSYDTSDTIEEFTVEFQVQYWYPEMPAV